MKKPAVKMKDAALTPELYCTNLKDSLKFYVGILGFKILHDRPENYFAMLERQGTHLMLEQIDKRNRIWLAAELEKPFGRGINFQIQTTNVETLYKTVQSNKYSIFLPLEEKWYRAKNKELGNKQFIVCDPDGYMLRFFEDIGKRPIQRTSD